MSLVALQEQKLLLNLSPNGLDVRNFDASMTSSNTKQNFLQSNFGLREAAVTGWIE